MLYSTGVPRAQVPQFHPDAGAGRRAARPGTAGFSLVEVLVVIAIVAVLMAVTLAALSRSRKSAKSLACLNNLRQIGVSFHLYAGDNKTRLPDPLPLETTWESLLSKYLPLTQSFQCPSDEEAFPALGSSYDWRDGGDVAASLAGRSLGSCRGDAILAFDALPGWHARRRMNVVRIDGSADAAPEQEALNELLRPVVKSESR